MIKLSELSPLLTAFATILIAVLPVSDSYIGVWASIIAFGIFIPQAVKVYRLRNNHEAFKGVSLGSAMFVVANAITWFVYAYVLDEFWIGSEGIVNLPLSLVIIAIVVRSRKSVSRVEQSS